MGMRQNIKLVYPHGEDFEGKEPSNIYLYSHWGGDEGDSPLKQDLRRALSRGQRWDDEAYLARIIMAEVIRENLDDETGFGLAPYEIDPEFPTIVVDLDAQTVDGVPFDKFIKETK